MPELEVIWIDGPDGNVEHLAEHGVTPEEAEQVLRDPIAQEVSDSSGRPIVFGYTRARRKLAVVYDKIDAITIYPITAYEVESNIMAIIRRSHPKLMAGKVRALKDAARRIDTTESAAIRARGRAAFARHERLRELVKALKAERQRQGLSLADLAARTGIAKPNLSRLENTTAAPTLDTLARYAQAVGKSLHVELVDAEAS